MGGDQLDREQVRVHRRNAVELGQAGIAGRRKRPGLTTFTREQLKQLEREHHKLKRANEILRKASVA